jgi:hypothetical protein
MCGMDMLFREIAEKIFDPAFFILKAHQKNVFCGFSEMNI